MNEVRLEFSKDKSSGKGSSFTARQCIYVKEQIKKCYIKLSHLSLSHIKQEYQVSLIQGKTHVSPECERRPRKLLKLNFRELYDSKLPGLRTFDNMAISLKLLKETLIK